MAKPDKPQIIVYGDYYEIHDNTCYGGGHSFGTKAKHQPQQHLQQKYAISKYDVDSFYFGFEQWRSDDAPVKGRAYQIYSNIAKTLLSQF